MTPRRLYAVVAPASLIAHLKLDSMRIRAKRLFPDNAVQAERWVQAKLYVAGRKPSIKIGDKRPVDTSRALRRAPAGLDMPLEIPRFLRRFLERTP